MPAPLLLLNVYYKAPNGWRAFCAPYDVSCEADTLKEVQETLDTLVGTYAEGLREYDYPEHLVRKELSDEEDQRVYGLVTKHLRENEQESLLEFFFKNYQGNIRDDGGTIRFEGRPVVACA